MPKAGKNSKLQAPNSRFGICYLDFPLAQLLHEWIRKSFATKFTKFTTKGIMFGILPYHKGHVPICKEKIGRRKVHPPLATSQLKTIGNFCEKTASAFFDAIMDTALQCVGLSKNNLVMNPES
jgi:hypothetical protein